MMLVSIIKTLSILTHPSPPTSKPFSKLVTVSTCQYILPNLILNPSGKVIYPGLLIDIRRYFELLLLSWVSTILDPQCQAYLCHCTSYAQSSSPSHCSVFGAQECEHHSYLYSFPLNERAAMYCSSPGILQALLHFVCTSCTDLIGGL